MSRRIAVAAFLISCAFSAAAEDCRQLVERARHIKPRVRVTFDLDAEHDYRRKYYSDDVSLKKIRSEVARSAQNALHAKLRFIDFTDAPSNVELRIVLAKRDARLPSASTDAIFRFALLFQGQEMEVEEEKQVRWVYRTSGDVGTVPIKPIESFIADIGNKLKQDIGSKYNEVVGGYLVMLPIADAAYTAGDGYFVLPMRDVDLGCDDEKTEFLVETEISTKLGPEKKQYLALPAGEAEGVPPRYVGKLKLKARQEASNAAASLERLKNAQGVCATSVYVKHFTGRRTPISPSALLGSRN